jgi:hypothetical protein
MLSKRTPFKSNASFTKTVEKRISEAVRRQALNTNNRERWRGEVSLKDDSCKLMLITQSSIQKI